MARRLSGPYVSGRLFNKQQGSPIGGATITVSATVYTDDEMQNATTTVTTNGTGDFQFYALPGLYTLTTIARDAAPIEPVEIIGNEGLGVDRSNSSGASTTLADRGAWVTTTAYLVGDVVTQSGQRWIANTAHTAGGTFAGDAAKWTSLDAVVALTQAAADARYDALGAASQAALMAGYGQTNGAPNSPAAGVTNGTSKTLGPNLWLTPTAGGGLSTAASPSITANSTTQSVKTRLNIGYVSSGVTTGTVANMRLRLTFCLTSTITTGWGGALAYQWTDSGGVLVSGTTQQVIVGTSTNGVTNYYGVIDVVAPATGGTSNLEIILSVANNSSSGTVTLNSMDVRRVGKQQAPIAVGWTAGTPNTAGATFSVFQPIIDPSTQQTTWAETQLSTDSALETTINSSYAWQTGMSTWQFSPLDSTGSASQLTPSLVRTGSSRTQQPGAPLMHVNNNAHVMGIINGSGAEELRCNTHGGETGRSGTYGTDYTFQYDIGDGVWRTCQTVTNLGHFCHRFQFIQHTKVVATTGETVAYIDYTWTFFSDGAIRQDRTVTFQRTQAMYQWFVWMSSFNPSTFSAVGKMGAGQAIHGGVDYRAKASAPTISSVTNSGTGGALAAATYSYKVTTLTAYGESAASAASTTTTTGTTSTTTVNWGAATAATGYRIYGRSAGTWAHLATVGASTTSWTDDGSAAVNGAILPPGYSTAWTGNAANDAFQDTLPDWAVYREAYTGLCFSKVIDRAAILANHPSATAVRGELLRISGSVCKNYFHVEAAAGGALTGGAQAAGPYPVTIPTGTVINNTSYDFFYLPADPNRYEYEQTVRAANVSQLTTIYPAA